MDRPIYRIPAREVVAGMLHSTQDGKYRQLVTSIERGVDGISMGGHGWFRCCPLDSTTYVSLPGPSPRELLCTCANWLPWAPNPGDPPTDHWNRDWWPECSNPCTVAPNLDPERGPVHGGLRLWPIGTTWYDREGLLDCGWTAEEWPWEMDAIEVRSLLEGTMSVENGYEDMFLQAFCNPPTVPDLPTALERRPTPWDPEDVHEVLG